jgi:hypothetical protein
MLRAPSKPQYARDLILNIDSIDTMKKAVANIDKKADNSPVTLFRLQIENMEKAVASLKKEVEKMEKINDEGR